MEKRIERIEVPKVKTEEEVVKNARKKLKNFSKSKLINIIINLSAKIDEMKAERDETKAL